MKKILSLCTVLLALTLVIMLVPLNVSATYDYTEKFEIVDVEAKWAMPYVAKAVRMGVVTGTSVAVEGGIKKITFDPDGLLTREQFVAILQRLSGADETEIGDDSRFTDVRRDEWYASAVCWAENAEIVEGIGNNKFGIGQNITRQEIAVMLSRYVKVFGIEFIPTSGDDVAFADAEKIAEWATEGVELLGKNKIIQGNEHELFNPESYVTRAETASIVTRFIYFSADIIKNIMPPMDIIGKVVIRGTEFPHMSGECVLTDSAEIERLFEYISAAEIRSVAQEPFRVGSTSAIAIYDKNDEFITWFLDYYTSSITLNLNGETVLIYSLPEGYLQPLLDATAK